MGIEKRRGEIVCDIGTSCFYIALDNVLGWECTQDLDCSVLPACREGSAAGSLHNVECKMLKG